MATDNPALNFVEYMKGVGDSAVNMAKEGAYGVYDFGQVAVGGAKILTKEGLSAAGFEGAAAKIAIEDIEPLSALGKVAATGGYEGLGNAIKDMPANVANAVGDAAAKGDMRALGTAVTDAAFLVEGARAGAVGAAKGVGKGANAVKSAMGKGKPAAAGGTAKPPAPPETPPAAPDAPPPPPPPSGKGKATAAKNAAAKDKHPDTSNEACPACDKKNDAAARADKQAADKKKGVDMDAFEEVYNKAPAAKAEIDAIADQLAGEVGGTVAKAPIKSRARALEKIEDSYGGDPTRIKDLARNTIIVPAENVAAVADKLEAMGAQVKRIDGATDPMGYSGVNATFKTASGLTGEIQVNSPAMIFAKESEGVARNLLGNNAYDTIAAKTGLPGGKGHALYEDWRVMDAASDQAKVIADQSKAYYDAIRTLSGN